jgi:hypothetical protein
MTIRMAMSPTAAASATPRRSTRHVTRSQSFQSTPRAASARASDLVGHRLLPAVAASGSPPLPSTLKPTVLVLTLVG